MNESWKETIVRVSRPIRYAVAAALTMLTIFLLVAAIDGLHNWGQSDLNGPNTITVTGEGMATAIPDTASISFTQTSTAADVATAESKMTDAVNAALAVLKNQGITSDNITTSSYSVSPHYSSSVCPPGIMCPATNTTDGYDVSETVNVKITDTSKVAAVLQGLAQANITNVSGPNFIVADDQKVMQQAREQAIQKAQADAKTLASQLGVHLGKITSFQDSSNGSGPVPMFKAAGVAAATSASAPSIPVGDNTYTDDVTITYEIN